MRYGSTIVAVMGAVVLASGASFAQESEGPRLTKAPRLKTPVEPAYPESARARGRSATVELALDLSAEGKVTLAKAISEPDPEFDPSAVAAALLLEFEPAEVDGVPAAVRITFRFHFVLETRDPLTPPAAEAPADAPPDGGQEETVVRAPRPRRDAVATALATDDGRHLPGTMGDALTGVQSLPGVARAAAGSSALVIWGSAPAETRIVIDDVPVPWLYHRGGLRSVVTDALVASVELVPGGFGADQGRAIGGLVRVATSPVAEEGASGELGVDFIGASGAVAYRQPAADGPHTIALGARYGWLSRLLPLVVKDIQQTAPLPESFDYVGKWLVRSGEATTQVLLFGAGDQVDRLFAAGGGEHLSTSFHRAALRHQQPLSGGGWVEAGLWVGVDRSQTKADYGSVGTSLDLLALRGGLRASLRQTFNANLAVTLGADVEGSRTQAERVGTLGLPAREGDLVVFGQPPSDQVAFERWLTHTLGAAAFVEAEISLARTLSLRPGIRFEPSVLEGERKLPRSGASVDVGYSRLEFLVEPRLSAQLKPGPAFTLSAAAGLYHQPPDAADLSAVFGNTSLGNSSGFHAVLGATVKPFEFLSVEGTAFFKTASGLAARSPIATPAVAQALVGTGEGRSYGGQLVLRPGTWKWLSGWASYALSRSERRSGPGSAWRLFDFDQTHVFVLAASVALPAGFRVGPRLRASTGFPRTPVLGATFDARTDTFQPVRGEQNAERLPPFFQLDLRAEKTFTWRAVGLNVFLDVMNVTNTPNPEEVTFSYDYSQRKYLTGLPILAVLGARLEL